MKRLLLAAVLVAVSLPAYSVSSNDESKIIKVTRTIDRLPRKSDVSLDIRHWFPGARPKITKINKLTFNVKFIYSVSRGGPQTLKRYQYNYKVKK